MKPNLSPNPPLPCRRAACLLALIAAALAATASDAELAAKFRALGAQVTESAGTVTKVSFKDCSKLGDTEFRDLGQLKSLKALTLYGQCHGLTDQTLPHLAGLSALEELGTDGIQVTDAGLAALTTLTNLRSASFFHIAFPDKGFTGAGFAAFKILPKLERLTVAGTPFNDRGMAAIGQLTQLKEFSTWHTYQTQAGNEHLLALKNLRVLKLGQRLRRYDGKPNLLSLDDATLAVVAKLTSLEALSFDEVRLTHAGLSALRALPALKKLSLLRTDIPEADLAKLRADLPTVTIDWKPLTDPERKAHEGFLKP